MQDEYGPAKRLQPKLLISDNQSDVFGIRFTPDGSMLAAACGDGSIRVFNTVTGRLTYHLVSERSHLPATCIRFRPTTEHSKTRNVLIASGSDGSVNHWHLTSRKCLHSFKEEENEVFALDFRPDGAQFATAGRDVAVRIYDEATKSLVTTLRGGYGKDVGHSNRVFSLKYFHMDPNIILSAGWDNTIQVWDIRTDKSIRSIFGPHICGDAVDIHGNTILTGSWRPEDQLQQWDFHTGKLIETIPWDASGLGTEACCLYTAQYSHPSGEFIVAGGSGSNEAKVFERETHRVLGSVMMRKGVYCSDFAGDGRSVAIAGGDGAIRILDIV